MGAGCSGGSRLGFRKPLVVEAGDSITRYARGRTNQVLRDKYTLAVFTRVGTVDGMIPTLREIVAVRPDVMIVELGSDEALLHQEDWQPAFTALLAVVAPVPCVEFTTVSPVE